MHNSRPPRLHGGGARTDQHVHAHHHLLLIISEGIFSQDLFAMLKLAGGRRNSKRASAANSAEGAKRVCVPYLERERRRRLAAAAVLQQQPPPCQPPRHH